MSWLRNKVIIFLLHTLNLSPECIYKLGEQLFSASQQTAKSGQQKTAHQLELEKAKFLMNQALDDDSAGNIEDAVSQYSEAVEVCLKIVRHTRKFCQRGSTSDNVFFFFSFFFYEGREDSNCTKRGPSWACKRNTI